LTVSSLATVSDYVLWRRKAVTSRKNSGAIMTVPGWDT
jgi:hypothetical protein